MRPAKVEPTREISKKTYQRIIEYCDAVVTLDDLEYGARVVLRSGEGKYLVDVDPSEEFLEITPIKVVEKD